MPSDDGTYITITEHGDYTREIAMEHTVEAHALGRELGIRCYLVDVTDARNVESTLTNYKFAHREVPQQPAIDQQACVAVLVDPTYHSHDFYETLSQNAGIDLTLFRDRQEAIDHLRRGARRLGDISGSSASA